MKHLQRFFHTARKQICIALSHISTQLILIVGITVAFVLSVTVMFFYSTSIKTIRENTLQSNEIILDQIAQGFDEYVDEIKNFSLNIRMDSNILSIMDASNLDYLDQETISNYLKAMYYSRHDLCDISLYLLKSNVHIGFSKEFGKTYSKEELYVDDNFWFQTAVSTPDYTCLVPLMADPQKNISPKSPFFKVYRIIINAYTKEPIAAIEVTCNASSLKHIFENLEKNPNSIITMTDSNDIPYFTSDSLLLDAGFSENISSDYMVVTNTSNSEDWILKKYIPFDVFTEQYKSAQNRSLLVLTIATLASVCAIALLVYFLTRSLQHLAHQMALPGKGDFKSKLPETGCYETRMLANQYNSMISEMDNLIQKNYIMALNEKTAKIQALESQINPHFLYNSLQVISSRILLTGDQKAYHMIEALAGNLRYAFKESELVPIHLELEYVQNYLLLLQARFENRLDFFLNVKPETNSILIPKISIFTMIENSIIHGLEASMDCLKINILITIEDNQLVISVSDNGPGIPPEELKNISTWLEKEDTLVSSGKHVGLKNLNARLKLYFGCDATLTLASIQGQLTATTMTVSLNTLKGENHVPCTDY